jgi:glycosyltransferase involved in cell wall biosynthesis
MKINIISPVPPARTSIAGDLWHSLPALQREADIALWTNQNEWDERLEQYARVRHFPKTEIWHELHQADMTVYHIGNNFDFHGEIWDLSRRHPGVVILHDPALQHLFVGFFREVGQTDAYVRLMNDYYGSDGGRAAQALLEGRRSTDDVASELPLTPLALENALGVLVHSRDAYDSLERLGRWPLAAAGLPFSPTPRPTSPRIRGAGETRRLIIFGFLGPNRRIDSVLEALAATADNERYRLDIYGAVWDPGHVLGKAEGLGLGRQVTLHGFVPAEELEDALARADLAINLRFPTMGESSGSQLRIWDHALPSLVTRIGWYSEIPDGTVAFVRQEHEIDDIRGHLESLFSAPSALTHMGLRGRRFLEERHSPRIYARQIVDLAARAKAFRAQASAHLIAKRVGSGLASSAGASLAATRAAGAILSMIETRASSER